MVMLALIIRLCLLPLTLKGYRTDALLESLAPKVREIEANIHLSTREQRDKITELMKQAGINPASEIISVVLQLAFLAVLYQVVQHGITPDGYDKIYSFVSHPDESLNTIFIFGVEVSQRSVLYSLITAGLLFVEQVWEYESKKNIPEATFSERWYPLLLPIFTFILLVFLPATKAVFLATSILFSLGVRLMYTLGKSNKGSEH